MAKTMTPSRMTDSQIERAVEIFRAQLKKYGTKFTRDAAQKVFAERDFGKELFAVFERRADEVSDVIIHQAKVDPTLQPAEAIKTSRFELFVDDKVRDAMPRGDSENVEIIYFRLGRKLTNEGVEKEYASRGLKAVDPLALIADNKANPDFMSSKPNATHWKDAEGNWCFLAFAYWPDRNGGRCLDLGLDDEGVWHESYWFAGVKA